MAILAGMNVNISCSNMSSIFSAGAIVPAEPADVVAARAEHLAHF